MRFWGTLENRGKTLGRGGTKKTGLTAHIRGWDFGIRVELSANGTDKDQARIYLTGGSKQPKNKVMLGTYTDQDL